MQIHQLTVLEVRSPTSLCLRRLKLRSQQSYAPSGRLRGESISDLFQVLGAPPRCSARGPFQEPHHSALCFHHHNFDPPASLLEVCWIVHDDSG